MTYCAVQYCPNTKAYLHRTVQATHVDVLKFHAVKKSREAVWAVLLERENLPKSTSVCSNHFVDGRPTVENPDPTLYLQGYDHACLAEFSRNAAEIRQKAAETTTQASEEPQIRVTPLNTCETDSTYPTNGSQTTSVMFSPKTGFKIFSEEMNKLKSERDQYYEELKKLKQESQKETDSVVIPSLRFDSLLKTNYTIKLYTGLSSLETFMWFYNSLEPRAQNLHYYKGKASLSYSGDHAQWITKPGTKRKLDLKSELLLTLMKLRLNLLEGDLAIRFNISISLVSSIFATWVSFLGIEMRHLIKWPTPAKIKKHCPSCFLPYGLVQVIIDCTEVGTQTPSLAKANSQLYSGYKQKPTVKVLVGCTPNGAVSYISQAACGSMSDKEIVMKSDFLSYIEKTSEEFGEQFVVMADRGFNIQELLLKYNVILEIPPSLKEGGQFTDVLNKKTKLIANARIHIERIIGQLKVFRIFQSNITLLYKDIIDHIFVICGGIVNLNGPIVPMK